MSYTNSHAPTSFGAFAAAGACLRGDSADDSYVQAYDAEQRSQAHRIVAHQLARGATERTLSLNMYVDTSALYAGLGGPVDEPFVTIVGSYFTGDLASADQVDIVHQVLEKHSHTPLPNLADPMLADALTRLVEFRRLKPDWNGYGGVPPSQQAVDDCVKFATSLPSLAIGPTATVSGQGEVGLFWEWDDGTTVELGFCGDTTYGYLAVLPDGRFEENEGVPMNGPCPSLLQEALGFFFGR